MIAVIIPTPGAAAGPTAEAIERQSEPPDRLVVAIAGDALPSGPWSENSWLWLVDAGVVPEPEALECLLAAAQSAAPAPVLLVSKVITPEGTLDPGSLPVPEAHRGDRVTAALEQRTVALRAARRGSMLISANGGGPPPRDQVLNRDLEWTTRLLRHERGLLVPTSVAVRVACPRPSRRARLTDTIRLLAAVEPRERLWFAAHLGERALASRRARAGR